MSISRLRKILPNYSAVPHYLLVRLPLRQRATVAVGVPLLNKTVEACSCFFLRKANFSIDLLTKRSLPILKIGPTPHGVTGDHQLCLPIDTLMFFPPSAPEAG